MVVPPKDVQVTRVLTAPAAAALKQPQMTHGEWMQQQTESRRPSRRIDSLKSRVTDGPQKPPKPVVQTTRARTTSQSKSALPRSSSNGAVVRRPSAHPPLHRRASRSPSGQATPASIMKEVVEGNAKICALMDRRLKQSAAFLRTLKARGIDDAIAEAVQTGDNVLLGEIIQHLNPKLWNLSLISRIASQLRQLLSDRNEVIVDAALAVLQTMITSFGDVLHQTSKSESAPIKCMEALRELRMNQSYLEERMAPLRRLKFSALMEKFDNNIETLK